MTDDERQELQSKIDLMRGLREEYAVLNGLDTDARARAARASGKAAPPRLPVGKRFWLAVRLVWREGLLIKERVNGTYTRELPRVVRGRGAAKRAARRATP